MKRWRLVGALIAAGLMAGAGATVRAQDIDEGDPAQFDRQPPPPPPPVDEDYGPGYRRPGAPDGFYGSPRRSTYHRFRVCLTPEGRCGVRAPQVVRTRCGCDFGDGWVPGRLLP